MVKMTINAPRVAFKKIRGKNKNIKGKTFFTLNNVIFLLDDINTINIAKAAKIEAPLG